MSQQNLKMFRGDDYSFDGLATVSGAAINLTSGTLRFTAKYSAYDTDGTALFTLTSATSAITINSAIGGTFTVNIPASATSALPAHRISLPYDLQLTDMNGKVYTILYGLLVVNPDVSTTSP